MNASQPSTPQPVPTREPQRLGEIIHDVLRQLAQAQAVTRMVAQSGDEDGDDVGLSLEVVDRLLGQASDRLSHLEQILLECPRTVYTDLDTSWLLSSFGEPGWLRGLAPVSCP